MKDASARLQKALNKHKLTDPANPETRARMTSYKKSDLKKILKKTGSYSIFFSVVTAVYYLLKKIGLGVSIMKSAVIVSVGSVTIVAAVSTGTYYTVKHIIHINKHKNEKKQEQNEDKKTGKTGRAANNKQNLVPSKTITNKTNNSIISEYGLVPFSANNVTSNLARQTTANLFSMIKNSTKQGSISIITRKNQHAVHKMIIGSVEKIENTYTITARLVQVDNAKILKMISETVDSKEKISQACQKITKKIMR